MSNDSPPEKIAAVDYETTYSKDDCSISIHGWDGYARHPYFECYLVAIKTNDGIEFVGHPKDAPWEELRDHHWISHNAGFDENISYVMKELEMWSGFELPTLWDCTMDMAAYLGYGHSLKNAVKDVFNVELSKEVRDSAAGKRPPDHWPCLNQAAFNHWEPMTEEAWQAMLDYALDDAVWCLKLWEACAHRWPEWERELSRHTRLIARRGVPVDIEAVNAAANGLQQVLFEFESCIPWREDAKLLSRAAFDKECAKVGITPPKSLAQDNAEADEWLKAHQPDYQWILAYRYWRKGNTLLKKVQAVQEATREVAPGEFRYFGSLKYCGAHTKRWSGGGSDKGGNLNLQNPPKGEQHFFCNDKEVRFRFREFFRAPKGRKLVAVDLSQIEVRTLTWASRDRAMLKRIEESPDIYQAFAEGFGLWSPEQGVLKEENNDLRQTVKPVVLGSGFGAGAWTFADKYSDELRTSVHQKYAEDEQEEVALQWLEEMTTRRGTWWWKKTTRLLDKKTFREYVGETSSGKQFTKTIPAWKVYEEEMRRHIKDLDQFADVPVDVRSWKWDTEKILILKEAEYCVGLYRSQMKKVVDFWGDLKDDLQRAVMDRHYQIDLPSGNILKYRNVKRAFKTDEQTGEKESTIYCDIVRNGRPSKMRPWPGLIAENIAQSMARDVVAYAILLLEKAGIYILFHVHDEIVFEADEDVAEDQLQEAIAILKTPPPFQKDLPVDADGSVGDTYYDCK